MKIIDSAVRGNLIRLYLGNNPSFSGDDWDDEPYEDNCGPVYQEYIDGVVDIAVPYEYLVVEPSEGKNDWSKNDMKDGYVPMLVIVKEDKYDWGHITFEQAVTRLNAHRVYMNTEFDEEDFKDYYLIKQSNNNYKA